MRPSDCPPSGDLQSYALGKLSEEASASLGAHLRGCRKCVVELDRLNDAADPLVARLRSPTVNAVAESSEMRAAIDRLLSPEPARAIDRSSFLPPATMLREYRIVEKLGAGGMGVVYRAVHTRIEKEVAIKVISSKYVAHPEAISRFGREMKAAGRFQHPNIVQATDGGEVDGVHFLVMEFVPGVNLSKHIRQHGTLSVSDACNIIAQAARGLQHAHEAGLIHRDVKPSNLLITPQGVVKVLDLGLALLRDDAPEPPRAAPADAPTLVAANSLTTTSHMIGTNDYIAPEQSRNAHSVDARADVFSLGCTLMYLLTGKPPERTIDGSFNLRVKRRDVPKELEAIALKMLAQRPEDRFTSAREVADAVARFVVPKERSRQSVRPMVIGIGALAAAIVAVAVWASMRTPIQQQGTPENIAVLPDAPPEELPMPRIHKARPPLGQLPMTDVEAKSLQKQWLAFTKAEAEPTNSLGMKFVLIPPGEFFIRPETKAQVRITRPFHMGMHEVTRKQFSAYIESTKKKTYHEEIKVGSWETTLKTIPNGVSTRSIRKNGLSWRNPGYAGAGDDDPVTHITWQEAVRFCEWLSAKEKCEYRLPTDAEWEWAARAGIAEPHPIEWLTNKMGGAESAWYYRSADDRPHPVGRLKPNAWGLQDCLGNVREWCSDWLAEDAPGLTEDPQGPKKGAANIRVVRGGDYRSPGPSFSFREGALHYLGTSAIGFRVVREIER